MATIAHLAQANIAGLKAPLDSPELQDFVARLDEINTLADRSPGFVWRLQGTAGNATYLRPFEDERVIFNMSVWEDVESLKAYVYDSAHREVLRRRADWFTRMEGAYVALWWIPVGHIPSIAEAKERLAHLEAHGPSEQSFTFQRPFPPDPAVLAATRWRPAEPYTS
jgi:hypothetical protein